MKKKIFLLLTLVFVLSCLFVITANAEFVTYDDAPAKTNIEVRNDDIVVFKDGFSCPSAYIFKDAAKTQDGSYWKLNIPNSMDFSFINSKMTDKTYTFEDIVELDIPQGITYLCRYAFYGCSTIKKVSVPDSVTTVGACAFENSSSLEECVFEHNEKSGLTSLPQYIFSQNVSLKHFSMPDCITTLTGEGSHFAGCSSLGAVYLSKNLTTIQGTRGDRPSFDGCANMYFVNEAFAPNTNPEKPTVYYFPSNLENFANQCVFRGCANLNDVLVLGTGITEISNGHFFQKLPQSKIVFLGDMTKVSVTEWGVSEIFFANKNDIDASNAGYSGTISAVFCNAEGNTTHLLEKSVSTDATCTAPKMTANYCFCGTIIGEPTTEGEALGHLLLDEDAYYTFTGFLVAGNKNIDCARGDCDHTEVTALESAIFTALGYSVKEYGVDGKCFTNGYKINNEVLDLYESTMGVKVGFGFGFNRADRFATEGEVTLDSFTISGYAKRPENDREFGAVEYKMTYENSETLEQDLAKDIVIAFYVVEVNNETGAETLTFVNKGEGAYNGFEAISYLGAAELAK